MLFLFSNNNIMTDGSDSINNSDIQLGGSNSKYPKITDDDFYKKINKTYAKYKIKKNKLTYNEFCFPKEYILQLPQQFVANYINPATPYKSLLIYHRIGSGKTCSAIQIAEAFKHVRKIIVVVPASLKSNFRDELRSPCAGDSYLTNKERSQLKKLQPNESEYINIIEKSNKRIDKVYTIYSYNKFISLAQDNEIKLKNSVLIIDEIQNMISDNGTYYQVLYDLIQDAPTDLRIVLLSASPMYDKAHEIAYLMNLLRMDTDLPINKHFYDTFVSSSNGELNVINMDIFKNAIKGHISYFRGAPPYIFPEMIIKYIKCPMSDFQYKAYQDVSKNENLQLTKKMLLKDSLSIRDLPNSFFFGTRVISNIVFPNKKLNNAGYKSLTFSKILEELEIYSIKFFRMMRKIKKSKGKIFIYSGFKEFGGLHTIAKILDAHGYKDYAKHGVGYKRYAIWTGDTKYSDKDEIKNVYNHIDNLYGNKIRILLGSPSIKEGVSLHAVRQVHVIDPYWNQSRIDQIIGRACRFCSHKHLPKDERNVSVYIYIAVCPKDVEYNLTIDEYMADVTLFKHKIVHEFEKALKESAVDCELNKNANIFKGDDTFSCSI